MNFEHSDKVLALIEQLNAFMDEHIYPNQDTYLQQVWHWKQGGRSGAH